MENVKLTKKDYFGILRDLVEGTTDIENKEGILEFIDHEVELLGKKRTTQTKAQKENEILVEEIYGYLEEIGEPVTIADLIERKNLDFTSQKMSALLKKLVDAGRVKKEVDKKKTYFSIV